MVLTAEASYEDSWPDSRQLSVEMKSAAQKMECRLSSLIDVAGVTPLNCDKFNSMEGRSEDPSFKLTMLEVFH
jgi:hypothetical protein